MPIDIQCDPAAGGCGARLRAKDSAAGRVMKCPKCGRPISVPAPDAPHDAGYELDLEPEPAAAPPPPDARIIPAKGRKQRDKEPEPAPAEAQPATRPTQYSSYVAAYTANLQQRDEYAKGPKPLFNVLGIDVTRGKLGAVAAVVMLVVGLGVWWVKWGPGRTHKVIAATPVYLTTALENVKRVEPYGLGGTGSLAAGVKKPSLSGAKTPDMLTVGGGDQLLVTRPDEDGTHLAIELELSQAFMGRNNMTSGYDSVFKEDAFELVPADGSTPAQKPLMVLESYDSELPLDIGASGTTNWNVLFPPGVPPTTETLEPNERKPVRGKRHYNGSAGVRGDVDFFIFRSDIGSGGFSADGLAKYTDPGGAEVNYEYTGGELKLSWNAGSRAHWSTARFTVPSGTPYAKYKVTLIFERPDTDAKLRLKAADKTVATLPRSLNAPEAPQPGLASSVNDPVTSYFGLLAQAREKARGTVSQSNMVQIGIAIQMYVDQNRGALPDTLEDLRSVMPGIDGVLKNQRTGENPGYVYVKPADSMGQISRPNQTPVLYESQQGRIDPNGAILYADGHIEPGS